MDVFAGGENVHSYAQKGKPPAAAERGDRVSRGEGSPSFGGKRGAGAVAPDGARGALAKTLFQNPPKDGDPGREALLDTVHLNMLYVFV